MSATRAGHSPFDRAAGILIGMHAPGAGKPALPKRTVGLAGRWPRSVSACRGDQTKEGFPSRAIRRIVFRQGRIEEPELSGLETPWTIPRGVALGPGHRGYQVVGSRGCRGCCSASPLGSR